MENVFEISHIPQQTFQLDNDFQVKIKKTIEDQLDLRHFQISQRMLNHLLMILIKIKENNTRNRKIKKKPKDEKFKLRSLSIDADIELDLESITNFLKSKHIKFYKIKGINIVKTKAVPEPEKEIYRKPMLFHSIFKKDSIVHEIEETKDIPDQDKSKGVIRYRLSDRTFIDKGWTVLPVEKIVRKLNVYRMRPAHPEFDWFAYNKKKGHMTYDTGEPLATFDDKGRGRWYYKNGKLALEYYDSEETNCQQRFVVYSSGEPDEKGRSRPITLLAMFDFLGNGVVFDHAGKIRIKYNQSDGVVLDRALGPACHWKWHTLNDPPVLQRVMMENFVKPLDPVILQFEDEVKRREGGDSEMLAIEYNNCIKERDMKLAQKFRPYQIKMKALRINDQFSLRVIDQANVHLTFKDGSAHLKLNLGMVIDTNEIVSTETQDVGNIYNSLDTIRGQTDSVINLQEKLENVRKLDRARTIQELKRKPMSKASADHLKDAISRPLHTLRTVKSLQCNNVSTECNCKRKPPYRGVYYDSRY